MEEIEEMLSERAMGFLRRAAEWDDGDEECPPPTEEEWRRVGALFGERKARSAREAFLAVQPLTGLTYDSPSWSLDERVVFRPELDVEEEDGFPALSLIEHTVAHPFSVLLDHDGTVLFIAGTESGGGFVRVFPSVFHLIESDAVHAECSGWKQIRRGRADDLAVALSLAERLDAMEAASGGTERWYERKGVRVHVCETFAAVFGRPESVQWAVWAVDSAAEAHVQELLRSASWTA